MSATLLMHNGDWHKQKPLRYSDCFAMSIEELLSVFYAYPNRKNTGAFLITDSLVKILDADCAAPDNIDRMRDGGVSTIVTTAFSRLNPDDGFDKEYWQSVLNLNKRLVPMPLGFTYYVDGKFSLTKDIAYILQQMSERNELGVRGEIAAEWLGHHGVKNVRVIGCPSLFYYMDRGFTVREKDKLSRININFSQSNWDYNQYAYYFGATSMQVIHWALALYRAGGVRIDCALQDSFTRETNLAYYTAGFSPGKVVEFIGFLKEIGRFFFSAEDWIGALKEDDFSIGIRLQGNIAAILAGTPALIISADKRTEETARTHHIPHMKAEDFDASKPVEYYKDLCDYTDFNKHYAGLYDNYVDYCRKNGVALRIEQQ